jgi:hypothetical protein
VGAPLLLAIPLALALAGGLLALSSVVEQRVLSPRSMIRTAIRSRHNAPEFAEAFVAREIERLLGDERQR